MKKIILSIWMVFSVALAFAQAPSLAVGLETLTLNKGQIDVQALTELIMEKQKELKQEALKRFMFKFFPQTNFTSKYYVQNCLHILLNEKNPKVIEKEILELTTNYALALGVASVVFEQEPLVDKLQNQYVNYKKINDYATDKLSHVQKKIKRRDAVILDLRGKVDKKKELQKKIDRLKRYKLRKGVPSIDLADGNIKNGDCFGLVLDVTSAALSGISELKSKGFFKNEINYKQDEFYLGLNDVNLKKTLDALQKRVDTVVTPYIKHYEIIREFYSKYKNIESSGSDDIRALLIKGYTNTITSELQTPTIQELILKTKNRTGIATSTENILNTLKLLEDDVRKLNEFDRSLNILKNSSNVALVKDAADIRLALDEMRELKGLDTLAGDSAKLESESNQRRLASIQKQIADNDTAFTVHLALIEKLQIKSIPEDLMKILKGASILQILQNIRNN